jgi:hypothetical protein
MMNTKRIFDTRIILKFVVSIESGFSHRFLQVQMKIATERRSQYLPTLFYYDCVVKNGAAMSILHNTCFIFFFS